MNDQALRTTSNLGAISVQDMQVQINLIQEYMSNILQENQHFGKIPGCGDKPTLLKPGAEKLCFAFNLRPEFEIKADTDSETGHREVEVLCRLLNKQTGLEVSQGIGSTSTMESKWRYRVGVSEATDFELPKAYWKDRDIKILEAQDESLKGLPLSPTKNDAGKWMIGIKGTKVEHDNPADYYNTVLKMAKKRAMVDAVITGTACSDIFTQDIEEIKQNQDAHQGKPVDPEPEEEKKEEKKTTKKKQEKKPPEEERPTQKATDKITDEQLILLDKKRLAAEWSSDDVKSYMKEHFKIDKGRELTVEQCNQLINAMEPEAPE